MKDWTEEGVDAGRARGENVDLSDHMRLYDLVASPELRGNARVIDVVAGARRPKRSSGR